MRIVLVSDSSATVTSIATQLRDHGVEVIYLVDTDPTRLVRTAVQEDADAIAAPAPLGAITALLAENGAADIAVVGVDSIVSWVVDTAGE
ncbi:hypothetical protein [Actinokineospora cianjurensis]|uniref:Response regulatory domain-containing protein n=1 Tax=Actinokineospora cianjurensis TaxID=585224 RepID=A0A421B9I0_9PSEU|nr:hypothetical protein [Actinokineospora cianjurensis]RLK60915.1 hypothetical protein CLV68_1429 [Actinokineospora cianjurensis]